MTSHGARLICSAELEKLTSLHLVGPDVGLDDDHLVVNFNVEWSSVHVLPCLVLKFSPVHYYCTSSIRELTALSYCSEFAFNSSRLVHLSAKVAFPVGVLPGQVVSTCEVTC